jgi:hypothetical protein
MPNERIATAEQRELIVLAVETTAERRDLYLSAEQRELLRQAAARLIDPPVPSVDFPQPG